MNLVELTHYTNDEESAETYLRERGILKTFEECPYCQSKRIPPSQEIQIQVLFL